MTHLNTLPIPTNLRENILTYFPNQGAAWLADLPATIKQVEHDWSIQVEASFSHLSVNYVAPVICADGTQAVLKAGVPGLEIRNEITALSHFNSKAVVKLLKADPEKGLLLLERIVPGTPLHESPANSDAIEVAAAVMEAIWIPPPQNHQFPTVAHWFNALADVRKRFDGGTGPLPPRLFDMAERLSTDLIASTSEPLLLHGDCHHHNIVLSATKGWLAIDPKGVLGDPVYELCSYLRNPLDLHERFDLSKDIPRRVDQFSEILGFSRLRIISWCLAEAILSASWSLDSPTRQWEQPITLAEVYADMI